MPWAKGQSGNPKGRAAEQETVRKLGKQHTPEAFQKVLKLMRESKDERVQLAAAQEVINRGYGKPSQPVDGDGEGGSIQQVMRVVWGSKGE